MTDEQRAVVAWMRRIMTERNWTAEEWARKSGVSPSTVSRAMRDDYTSTTSLPVLNRLAISAAVTSPVAFLEGTAAMPTVTEVANFLAGYLASSGGATAPRIAEALFDHFGLPQ